ncbi:MAG: maleylpyruvate isomerase N-terminal domain-containing protein, partial [Anaerolineae bacterium]|nr:maleylpyruvate isomerase N-terminal domain-containing protein [Anaerolineae bacterium]
MNASDLIEKIEQSYSQIVRLYRSVPVNALLEPSLANGWSVKDLLAHIAVWEWRCVALLEQSHESNMPLQAVPDVEALNEEIFQEHKERDWEDIDSGFREAHEALLKAIREFPAHRL